MIKYIAFISVYFMIGCAVATGGNYNQDAGNKTAVMCNIPDGGYEAISSIESDHSVSVEECDKDNNCVPYNANIKYNNNMAEISCDGLSPNIAGDEFYWVY